MGMVPLKRLQNNKKFSLYGNKYVNFRAVAFLGAGLL
jgi:hypothetical protein